MSRRVRPVHCQVMICPTASNNERSTFDGEVKPSIILKGGRPRGASELRAGPVSSLASVGGHSAHRMWLPPFTVIINRHAARKERRKEELIPFFCLSLSAQLLCSSSPLRRRVDRLAAYPGDLRRRRPSRSRREQFSACISCVIPLPTRGAAMRNDNAAIYNHECIHLLPYTLHC